MSYYNYSPTFDTREFKLSVGPHEFNLQIETEFPYQVQDEDKNVICACKTQEQQERVIYALASHDQMSEAVSSFLSSLREEKGDYS